ncbi:MAG: GNAT family N-acetyltransferase [Methanobacteriota archaeon]
MSTTSRPYNRAKDFDRIGRFLIGTYAVPQGNWLHPRWEYMHFHPILDTSSLSKIGVWEERGEIVGVVNYEGDIGHAFFQLHPDHLNLKGEMLDYALKNLTRPVGSRRRLVAWINDFDAEMEALAAERGFRKDPQNADAQSSMQIPKPFPKIELPDGFRLQSLADENDILKVHRIMHRGFNNNGEPPMDGPGGPDCRRLMQSAPNFRRDLNIVAVAPDGSYVSYGGIWYQQQHKICYVEPVATDPEYRMMGLGKAVVMDSIRRCGELGATLAYVGSGQTFYKAMGFVTTFNRNPWIWMSRE